jgi:hypothetical protein
LKRAIAKDPAARYASGAELVDALRDVGQTTVVSAATAGHALPRPVATPTVDSASAASASAPAPAARSGRTAKLAALGLVIALLLAAGIYAAGGLRGGSKVAGEGGGLVTEEAPGIVGKVMGHETRLRVTVPSGTRLRLALEAPLSSESARQGDAFTAEATSPLKVEGVEVVPSGARFTGTITEAAPAKAAEGRGHMTLSVDSVELPDAGRVGLHTRPLALRAPSTKKKDAGLVGGLAAAGAVVGGIIGGKGGAMGGAVVGGAAGVAVVTTDEGHEVTLPSRASLTVELAESLTITRPKSR